MAYDAARERIEMHGGSVGLPKHSASGQPKPEAQVWYDETWEYDGLSWKPFAVAGGPGTRAHHCMTYDPLRRMTLLVGGSGQDRQRSPDTWAWNGASWQKLAEGGPAPRSRTRMAFHEP